MESLRHETLKVLQVLLTRSFKSWTIFPLPCRNFVISIIPQVSSVCSSNVCRGTVWAANPHHPWLDHDLGVGNDPVKFWKMPPAAPPLAAVIFWPVVSFQLPGEGWGEPGQRSQWVCEAQAEWPCRRMWCVLSAAGETSSVLWKLIAPVNATAPN